MEERKQTPIAVLHAVSKKHKVDVNFKGDLTSFLEIMDWLLQDTYTLMCKSSPLSKSALRGALHERVDQSIDAVILNMRKEAKGLETNRRMSFYFKDDEIKEKRE